MLQVTYMSPENNSEVPDVSQRYIASNSHKITLLCTQTSVKANVLWVTFICTKQQTLKEDAPSCGLSNLPASFFSSPWEGPMPPEDIWATHKNAAPVGGTLSCEDRGNKIRQPGMQKSEQEKSVRYFNSFCWYKIPVLYLKDVKIHNKTSFFNRHFCCTWFSCAFSFNFN